MSPKSTTRKPFNMLACGLVAGAVLGAAVASVAIAQTMTKPEVEKIVKAYIASHGDELVSSINDSLNAAKAKQVGELIDSHTPVLGPKTAPVTVIEFGDFECPFCGRAEATVQELQKQYGDKVRWAYKNMPLPFHPHAMPAAKAAMAAFKQGKFWEYTRLIWENQQNLSHESVLTDLAKQAGLDMDTFNADRASQEVEEWIKADMMEAQQLGADGTPYFIINGQAVSGALPKDSFEKVIDAALAKAKGAKGQ